MNDKDNPLTEHDAQFLADCCKAIRDHPHDGAMETIYNLSLMFFHSCLSTATQCADGRDAGMLMLGCIMDEAKQDAIRQIIAADLEEEAENNVKH